MKVKQYSMYINLVNNTVISNLCAGAWDSEITRIMENPQKRALK